MIGLTEIFIFLSGFILFIIINLLYGLFFKEGKNTVMIKAIIGSAYFTRVNEFKIYNRFAKPGGIVFVGDSLTQRYPLNEFYPGLPTYNRGIDGDTTTGLMRRLDVSIFDLNPKVVVLLIGTNDLQVGQIPREQTVLNIGLICDAIEAKLPAAKIVLVSLYPVNETGEKLVEKIVVGPRKNSEIQLINEEIKGFKNIIYADVYPHLVDEFNQLNMRYSKEGLHLSLNGYSIITPVIRACIEHALAMIDSK
jgi:lysophospholipase L1-like esterase